MAYTDVKFPKTWQVTCCSNEELGLQAEDCLVLEGNGNGGPSSTLFKVQGVVKTPWGFGCSYSSNQGNETVTGVVDSQRLFSLKFGVSPTSGTPNLEGEVFSKPESTPASMPANGQETDPNPGGGSWTAEQGG